MKNKNEPGELEFTVLLELDQLQEASVSELHKRLPDYAYTTLLTVLARLFKKKKVRRRKLGRHYVYSPIKNAKNTAISRIVDKLFGGKRAGLIEYLVDSSEKLTKAERKKIEELLRRAKDD